MITLALHNEHGSNHVIAHRPMEREKSKPSVTQQLSEDRLRVRSWIEQIEDRFRVSKQQIAERAGFHHATIYRWFNNARSDTPSAANLRKIANAFDVPLPADNQALHTVADRSDAVRVEENARLSTDTTNDQDKWRVNTRALELAGYLPGDVVTIDRHEKPRTGDVVLAQVYNLETAEDEIRLRVFEAPYLTTRTMDQQAIERPLYVDGERVMILGIVVRVVRIRAS